MTNKENIKSNPKKEDSNDLKENTELETLEFIDSAGLLCDFESGLCGPVDKKGEESQ